MSSQRDPARCTLETDPDVGFRAGRYRVLAVLLIAYLVIGATTRIALWTAFGDGTQVSLASLVFAVIPVGVFNDAVASLVLLAPVGLVLWLAPAQSFGGSGVRRIGVAAAAVVVGMLWLAVAEYQYFGAVGARFDIMAVEALCGVWRLPHLPRDVALPMIAAVLLVVIARRILVPSPERAAPHFAVRTVIFVVHAVAIAFVVFLARGDLLEPFANHFADELAGNGPAKFATALHRYRLDYRGSYRSLDEADARQRLRDDLLRGDASFVSAAADSPMTRAFPAHPDGYGKLNVVIIMLPSPSAGFAARHGDPRGLMPRFDALASQGLLFTHGYGVGMRNTLALQAISASLPPIPGESLRTRTGRDRIVTWGEIMNGFGYRNSLRYAGAEFADVEAFFTAHGFSVDDRADRDADLLRRAADAFDQESEQGRPFFSIILMAPPSRSLPARGIVASREADDAIGRFFDVARTRDWYGNTVFVMVGSHASRAPGAADIPLQRYEIPLLMLAPGHLSPGRIDTPTSQLDIAPTVLGMLGMAYKAPFFGQDVRHWHGGERSLLFNHDPDVAMLRAGELAILAPNRASEVQSYHRRTGSAAQDVDDFHPAPYDRELVDLAVSYYQIASRLRDPAGLR